MAPHTHNFHTEKRILGARAEIEIFYRGIYAMHGVSNKLNEKGIEKEKKIFYIFCHLSE